MRVGRLVDGHIVDKRRKIRPVIKAIAAQQELVRFALATMQSHDQTRNSLKKLARTIGGRKLNLFLRYHAFACCISRTEELNPLSRDGNLIEQRRSSGKFQIRH